MAAKTKINQPVHVNGEKRWITANRMQEFADKVLKLAGTVQAPGKHLFSGYAWNWFEPYSAPNIETVTAATYRRQLRLCLVPAFEGMAVEDITTDADYTKSRRIKITGRATPPYTVEQVRYLVQHIGDLKKSLDRAYLALQALHPIRLEEVPGLYPEDIDTERTIIHDLPGRDPSHLQPAGDQGHQDQQQSPHHRPVRPGPPLPPAVPCRRWIPVRRNQASLLPRSAGCVSGFSGRPASRRALPPSGSELPS